MSVISRLGAWKRDGGRGWWEGGREEWEWKHKREGKEGGREGRKEGEGGREGREGREGSEGINGSWRENRLSQYPLT